MYADDMVLLADTLAGLQKLLDSLQVYVNRWDLTVDTDKTKTVIFRKGGKINVKEKWFYNDTQIEVVANFNYHFNGKFCQTQKHVADQGMKALFAVNCNLKKFVFNPVTKCFIFDTKNNSVLSYECEIWGFHKSSDIYRKSSLEIFVNVYSV